MGRKTHKGKVYNGVRSESEGIRSMAIDQIELKTVCKSKKMITNSGICYLSITNQ